MTNKRLLLISNGSELIGASPSEFFHNALKDFLGTPVRRVLFVPFAAVTSSEDEYRDKVRGHFGPLGYEVESLHEARDARAAVGRADAVAVGGGNTFKLLRGIYEAGVFELLRERAEAGMPYVGWSAGTNVACPTIRTTNDMPIVEPPSFEALNLVPFQINPHYTDYHPPGHMGETRDERLGEFVHVNSGVRVIGIREGTMLRVEGEEIKLLGGKPARVFGGGAEPFDVSASDSLRFLLG